MIPKASAGLLTLLVLGIAAPAGAAKAPAPPSKPPAPPVLLGGVEPLSDSQAKVAALLDARRWQEARTQAHQQLLVRVSRQTQFLPRPLAADLVLEALADAGAGEESTALCRWYVAQHLHPGFLKADLSRFGKAGALLARHPALPGAGVDPEPLRLARLAKTDPEVHKPRVVSQTPPLRLPHARRANVQGSVILDAIVETDGSVSNPSVRPGQPLGFDDIFVLDTVCNWRFKPGTLKGEPVRMYYSLTVDFHDQTQSSGEP